MLFGFAASTPYVILGLLTCYDMIESLKLVELCVMVGFGFVMMLVAGVIVNLVLTLMLMFIMLTVLIVAYVSTKCCAWRATKRSRVALLCECRYATALLSPEML